MLRDLLLVSAFAGAFALHAQPDSLYVTGADGSIHAHAVVYPPLQTVERFIHVGHYAFDTTRMAVRMDFKRGRPSGVFRAYYPDGARMIFAVYGWGSLHGDWTEYGPTGEITVKGQYRNGKRDGRWAFRSEGILGRYKDGLKSGKWKYYQDGKLSRSERYRKDKLRTGSSFFFGL
ncbi:MAG TPA: hypothetical protein VGE21_13930 [Flavobacteriales bacterium]